MGTFLLAEPEARETRMNQVPTDAPRSGLNIRKRLEALPFVQARPDGSLDLWSPLAEGQAGTAENAFGLGRFYGAQWLALMRDTGNAGMLYHLNCAYRGRLPKASLALHGMLYEIAYAVSRAPAGGSPALTAARAYCFRGLSATEALSRLPWASSRPGGGVDLWGKSRSSGEWEQDRATGRHYGAIVCELVRQTGWLHFLATQPETPPEDEEIMVGVFHTIGEVAIASSPTESAYQAADCFSRKLSKGLDHWCDLPDLSFAL